jgi:retron-type reverse transcriptase
MPRSSRATARQPRRNTPTTTRAPLPRERVRCVPGMLNSSEVKVLYQSQPVKRVEIPKPDGGIRKLGVPCVVDRLIQQALLQVLQERWDPTFSEHSYGFRPGRSAHQAVAQAQRYIAEGYSVVVDLDLEKIFRPGQSRRLDGACRRAGVG